MSNSARSIADLAMYRPKEPVYIALEDLDFGWLREDVDKVVRWYSAGVPFRTMCEVLARDPDEVATLIMSLSREGKIKPRKGGIWG